MHLPEVAAEAATLLQGLREHVILPDVVVADGAPRELHGLLEVDARDLGHRVLGLHLHRARVQAPLLHLPLAPHVHLNALADRQLARPLTDLGDVGATEAVRRLGQELNVNVLGDRRLAESGYKLLCVSIKLFILFKNFI